MSRSMQPFLLANLALLKELSKLYAILALINAVATGLPIPWWQFAAMTIAAIFLSWAILFGIALLYTLFRH